MGIITCVKQVSSTFEQIIWFPHIGISFSLNNNYVTSLGTSEFIVFDWTKQWIHWSIKQGLVNCTHIL